MGPRTGGSPANCHSPSVQIGVGSTTDGYDELAYQRVLRTGFLDENDRAEFLAVTHRRQVCVRCGTETMHRTGLDALGLTGSTCLRCLPEHLQRADPIHD